MRREQTYQKILYYYFQSYLFNLPKHERIKFTRQGLFGKLRAMLTVFLLLVRDRFFRKTDKATGGLLENKHWIFIFGKNNLDSTEFLKSGDFIFVTDRVRNFPNSQQVIPLPCKRRFRSYFCFPSILYYLVKTEGSNAWKISDLVFSAIGWHEAFDELIKKCKPKSVIFSNDHSFIPRALLFAAKKNSIPTIYIQHASISKYMPPLEFDLSLLEGRDAMEKYQRKGISGEVTLVGIPKFDAFFGKRKKYAGAIRTIGIAFNTVDSTEKIVVLIKRLLLSIPGISIILRSHPKENRNIASKVAEIVHAVSLSDSKVESPFDFILKCDLLIAGDSSIHLEAKMLNVESVYYDLSTESTDTYDLYGYIQNNFVKDLGSLEDLVEYIRTYQPADNISQQAQPYNIVLNTPDEGRSTELATQRIHSFLEKWYHGK